MDGVLPKYHNLSMLILKVLLLVAYQMNNDHHNFLPTTWVVHHVDEYLECIVDIPFICETMGSTALRIIVCLPAKLGSVRVEAHSCQDAVEEVALRDVRRENYVTNDLFANWDPDGNSLGIWACNEIIKGYESQKI